MCILCVGLTLLRVGCETFRSGNGVGWRTKRHLWTVSLGQPWSESHGRWRRPPRPRRAARRGRRWWWRGIESIGLNYVQPRLQRWIHSMWWEKVEDVLEGSSGAGRHLVGGFFRLLIKEELHLGVFTVGHCPRLWGKQVETQVLTVQIRDLNN